MDWNILITGGILSIAIAGFFVTSSARYFTIREYNEFKNATQREFDQVKNNVNREVDILRRQILTLEQTRPTTGELEARLTSNIWSIQKNKE